MKLNPSKCVFEATFSKLFRFIVSERGIEIDSAKIKAINDMPAPRTETEVRSFLGRLNYIGRFIAHLTLTCEPLFKLLRKDTPIVWNNACQEAFDKVKQYLLNPPVLVPPTLGRPLIMYLAIHDTAIGCVLGQHDESGRKERAIYYLSKKFHEYELKYTMLEKTCCALVCATQRLRHYMLAFTIQLISRMDPP